MADEVAQAPVADTQTAADTTPPAVDTQPVADTQAAPTPPPVPGDTSPAPPAVPEKDEREQLLDVVQAAVTKAPVSDIPGGEETEAAPGDPPKDPAETQPVDLADPTEDELKALPPRTSVRIKNLLKQRGEARAEVETLKPAAAKWQQLDGYLTQHDLAPEDVNLLLGVGAALRRGDFKAFREGVMPYIELANQHLGLSLPADLQVKVDAGEMTTEAATELSVARLSNTRLTNQVTANIAAAQQITQREQQAQVARVINDAVTSWENDIRSRDPDYVKKAPTVLRVSQALIAEHGQPTTAQQAISLAQRALDETNRMFADVMPARPASRPQPIGAHTINHARAEPTTLMEAARLGLEKARARPRA